ncbi:MAG TPA: APC family permease, partial [Propionibacteriaceae bacterium]|nr:APC family permease [Propionibacteriaceae bacterium]
MAESTAVAERPGHQPELKRVMGPKLLLLFIVGDILGTGIYAVTGNVAKEVGGVVWLPFLIAFIVATLTAFSYLELVTKYPQAAGAALYTHRAFGLHFLTFLICFTVMCSGITSASTASRAFAANLAAFSGVLRGEGADVEVSAGLILVLALIFIALVAATNLRGVAESVNANIVLTLVELSGLLIVIFVGIFAVTQGKADFSRVVMFDTPEDKSIFIAVTAGTSLAFFAMVGFEDSVNMAEETKNPETVFPRIMLTGLGITGVIYILVSITAIALVPAGELGEGEAPLTKVVAAGAPNLPIGDIFPLIAMFAVANSALINMMMASRLLYGMAKQGVLPPVLGRVLEGRRTPWVAILFTTAIAVGLLVFVGTSSNASSQLSLLGGTTALLLLAVFTVVNICCLVLR